MEIVLEKSQVVDLRLDLHKQGISIGDGTVMCGRLLLCKG